MFPAGSNRAVSSGEGWVPLNLLSRQCCRIEVGFQMPFVSEEVCYSCSTHFMGSAERNGPSENTVATSRCIFFWQPLTNVTALVITWQAWCILLLMKTCGSLAAISHIFWQSFGQAEEGRTASIKSLMPSVRLNAGNASGRICISVTTPLWDKAVHLS